MAAINGEGATLYAAGFNAHSQLQQDNTKDLHAFAPIYSSSEDLRVVFLGWSSTILMSGSRVFSQGFQQLGYTFPDSDTRLHSAVGDHNGMKACLDQSGQLYIVQGTPGSVQSLLCHESEFYSIKLLAYAQNGKVAMVLDEQSNCVYEFESFEKFLAWNDEGIWAPHTVHELPGPAEQLLGGRATFVLSTGNEILTWGDGRFQSLGRPVSIAQSPGKPSVLEDLRGAEGARWKKIAANGWMSAALGENNALYVWGANPSVEGSINAMQPGEACLVELPTREGDEPLDVLDMGLGTNHLVVLAKDGPRHRVFVTGANRNGQLGLQGEKEFEEDWQEVENVPNIVKAVFCGPKSTFLLT